MAEEKEKRESLEHLDKDLIKNGFSKKESDTHITYTRELSENVSTIFKKIEEAKK